MGVVREFCDSHHLLAIFGSRVVSKMLIRWVKRRSFAEQKGIFNCDSAWELPHQILGRRFQKIYTQAMRKLQKYLSAMLFFLSFVLLWSCGSDDVSETQFNADLEVVGSFDGPTGKLIFIEQRSQPNFRVAQLGSKLWKDSKRSGKYPQTPGSMKLS